MPNLKCRVFTGSREKDPPSPPSTFENEAPSLTCLECAFHPHANLGPAVVGGGKELQYLFFVSRFFVVSKKHNTDLKNSYHSLCPHENGGLGRVLLIRCVECW